MSIELVLFSNVIEVGGDKCKYHTLKLEKINTNVTFGSSSLLDTTFIFREVSSYNRGECVVHETNVKVGELECL